MNFELKQHFQIESARFLPYLPKTHPCSRTHGHSFKIILTLVGPLDPKVGWVIDYNEIQAILQPILQQIDHKLLNEVPGLENPTSENLCYWLFEKVKPKLNYLSRVTVAETPSTECSYPA
ncbi:MAG: 6-carboxytetrahydropterin synthase QueD [Bdellovibrionia bacterium]